MRQVFIFILSVFAVLEMSAQGASVSPSRLYYNVAPGGYKTQKILVRNTGNTKESYQITFRGFNSSNKQGKTSLDSIDESTSCADWLTASPAFFELEAGASQEVEILIQVPNIPEANTVRWSVISVKLAKENKAIDQSGGVQSAMQIVQSFQFLIHVFQTPPSVTYKEATIDTFNYVVGDAADTTSVNRFELSLENTGDAVIDCFGVVEMFNPETGEEVIIKSKRAFTILPKGERIVTFKLPKGIKPGQYEVFAWIDYGSDEHIAKTDVMVVEIK
jgi:P pilus assembly chaperone PapD